MRKLCIGIVCAMVIPTFAQAECDPQQSGAQLCIQLEMQEKMDQILQQQYDSGWSTGNSDRSDSTSSGGGSGAECPAGQSKCCGEVCVPSNLCKCIR